MWFLSCLGGSIHFLSYPCIDVSFVCFFLEIVFVHKLLWYHCYLYHDIFCPVHLVFQVKIFYVHAHVPCFDVWDGAVNMDFHCGRLWCWCADISCIIYKISSFSESCPMSICFLWYDIADCYHVGCLSVICFFLVEDELYCVCSRMFFYPWDRHPSLLRVEFVHTVSSILTKYLYPEIFQWFCSWCGLLVVPLWLYFFWVICEQCSMCLCLFSLFLPLPF